MKQILNEVFIFIFTVSNVSLLSYYLYTFVDAVVLCYALQALNVSCGRFINIHLHLSMMWTKHL